MKIRDIAATALMATDRICFEQTDRDHSVIEEIYNLNWIFLHGTPTFADDAGGELMESVGLAERLAAHALKYRYGPEQLYRQQCAWLKQKPRRWDDVDEYDRIRLSLFAAAVFALEAFLDKEEAKPEPPIKETRSHGFDKGLGEDGYDELRRLTQSTEPSNRDASADGEASSGAAPQGEALTVDETLADREGITESAAGHEDEASGGNSSADPAAGDAQPQAPAAAEEEAAAEPHPAAADPVVIAEIGPEAQPTRRKKHRHK